MRHALWGQGALGAIALILAGCATRPATEVPITTQVETTTEQDTVVVQESVVESPPTEETVVAEPTPPEKTGSAFEVTEEVYTRTFEELEQRIREWNALIARKDYEGWYASLSKTFVMERGSAAYLAELSRNQKLKDLGIVLKTLKDYFNSVVVPARVDAALGKIEFVDESKVKAYALIGDEPAILYYVVREDGRWKIGTSSEMASDRRLG
jgi:hypothetical protein